MTDNPDTMTNEELAQAWAEMMGWKLGKDFEPCRRMLPDVYYVLRGEFWCEIHDIGFSPSTSWADFGITYEWMRGREWWAQIWMMPEITRWAWCKGGFKGHGIAYVEEHDPDLRRASLVAGLKAEKEGK